MPFTAEPSKTPVSLLERLRRPDDSEAWSRFADLYTPILYLWVRRRCTQDADAADIVQDLVMHLFRILPNFRYDEGKSFRNWLRVVALNKVREFYRRVGAAGHADLARVEDIPAPDDPSPDEVAVERASLIRRALAQLKGELPELPERTWAAFQQYVIADRPAEEVAAELGQKVGTVYAAKSRVLSRLREELAGLL